MLDAICTWSQNIDDESGMWETTCSEAFLFNDGGPKDNSFRFCCYCGKPLKEHRYGVDDTDAVLGRRDGSCTVGTVPIEVHHAALSGDKADPPFEVGR